jgi:hypothetical protein
MTHLTLINDSINVKKANIKAVLYFEIFILKVKVAGGEKHVLLQFGQVGACSKEREILRKLHILVFRENASCVLFWRLLEQKILFLAS